MAGAPGSVRVLKLAARPSTRWSRARSIAAHGVHRREPFALADPIFEVGAQLLAERGAALLVGAACEAFRCFPRLARIRTHLRPGSHVAG
jgi:hypothetical protein